MEGTWGKGPSWSNLVPPKFSNYAILLIEDKDHGIIKEVDPEAEENFLEKLIQMEPAKTDSQVTRVAKLLAEKIELHSGEKADILGPDDIIERSPLTLAPVLYRISIEGFVKKSSATFRIIECRNVTKLSSDWKPSLPDFLIGLEHQVILVELKDEFSAYYNDFSYAVLRQINFSWQDRLPRSFFHPDDVCTLSTMPDRQVMIITPTLPDGELEFSHIKSKLQHDIVTMLKNSCLSAMQNHLLLRDLRIGKLGDTMDGFECIRGIYRELQRRIKSGEKVVLGSTSEHLNLFMSTKAGLTISSAESLLTACKLLDIETDIERTNETWDQDSEDDEPIIEVKTPIPLGKWEEIQFSSQTPSQSSLSPEKEEEKDEEDEKTSELVNELLQELRNLN